MQQGEQAKGQLLTKRLLKKTDKEKLAARGALLSVAAVEKDLADAIAEEEEDHQARMAALEKVRFTWEPQGLGLRCSRGWCKFPAATRKAAGLTMRATSFPMHLHTQHCTGKTCAPAHTLWPIDEGLGFASSCPPGPCWPGKSQAGTDCWQDSKSQAAG